jgi:AraC family transcriptional regulator
MTELNCSTQRTVLKSRPHDLELDQRFLRGPSVCGVTSRGLQWTDYVVEEHSLEPGEREESVSPHVSLLMWRGPGATVEINIDGRRFIPFIKYPGIFCFSPAGPVPAFRSFIVSEVLIFAMRPSLMETVKLEMDRRPTEEARARTGFCDAGLRQLITLLSAEAAQGGPFGRLYADSLAHAIATRLLLSNEKSSPRPRFEGCALPGHLVQRVIERMRDLNTDLDLPTLAAETGYSPRHFIRMFHAATGQTPHRYLIQLRLEHAKKLLRQSRTSLIDVAAACGFSSHGHLTHAFRRVLGVTPSEYRNNL